MDNPPAEQAWIDDLQAAGCDGKTVRRFLALKAAGNQMEQFRLLATHRRLLPDRVHEEERRIRCLDCLVYRMRETPAAHPQ